MSPAHRRENVGSFASSRLLTLLVASAPAVVACSAADGPTSVTQLVGPEGGTVEGPGGASVLIPPNALLEEVEIGIAIVGDSPERPEGSVLAGDSFSFTPHGVAFELAVSIRVPVGDAADGLLRFDDEMDITHELIGGLEVVDQLATLDSTHFSHYQGVQLYPGRGPDAEIVPSVCTHKGVVDQGAADFATTDFLCDERGDSLHGLVADFPEDLRLEDFADQVGVAIADFNQDISGEDYGLVYMWVDDVFVGRLPRPTNFTAGCGLPSSWLTLVLEPGPHTVRAEAYASESCTRYFQQSSVICGDDFDPEASMVGFFSDVVVTGEGTCSRNGIVLTRAEPPQPDSWLTADINGAPFTATSFTGWVNDTGDEPFLVLHGQDEAQTDIGLSIPSPDFIGECTGNTEVYCVGSYSNETGSYYGNQCEAEGDSHRITVTSSESGGFVEGTFSFVTHREPEDHLLPTKCMEPTVEVTSGQFRIARPL